jgi:hypothetical protein
MAGPGRPRKNALPAAQGIGESKPFIAPAGTFDPPATQQCHVGGLLVSDLPQEVQDRILYRQTDEGIEEANRGKVEVAARVTESPLDKDMQRRRDFLEDYGDVAQSWESPNPLKEVADAHAVPGMRPKFLSPAKIERAGLRGYKVVRHENGDPVKLGNLILGHIPEERAEARQRHFAKLDEEKVKDLREQFQQEQERAHRDFDVSPPPAGRDRDQGLQRETVFEDSE